MITDELYTFLCGRAAITALVGVNSIQLAPADLTVTGFPLLTFATSNEDREQLLNGAGSLVREEVIFQCAAKSPADAKALAKAVRDNLNGFVGLVGTIYVVLWYTSGQSDGFDENSGANFVNLNMTIWHRG